MGNAPYQGNETINDLWKKNLECLVNSRSMREVLDNKEIADPIKLFMGRDSEGIFGSSFTVIEKRGKEDFILGDAIPVQVFGRLPNGGMWPGFSYFSISPERILCMLSNSLTFAPERVYGFEKGFSNFRNMGWMETKVYIQPAECTKMK